MQVKIEKLDDYAKGIAYLNNKITFISNSLPCEVLDISLTKQTKKYNEGEVVNYISQSPDRVKPICPYFSLCGGCHLMHTTYENTLKFKKEKVINILHKFANIDIDINIIPSPKPLNYRNKVTFKVKNNQIGYYQENTHTFIKITSCFLAKESINNFFPNIKYFNIQNGEITIRSNYNDELLIIINTKNKITIPPNLANFKVVGVVLNDKTIYGENHFIEIINNTLYQISYNSFFQINYSILPLILNDLSTKVLPNQNILDLYCGVGTLSLALKDKAKNIYGIEIVPNAILNALTNAKMNKVENTYYHLGDVKEIISKLNVNIDCLIIDPPRKGLDTSSYETILKLKPKQIIYMSCDVITLARDLNILKENYQIEDITAYDMFPYTYHVECVSVLRIK